MVRPFQAEDAPAVHDLLKLSLEAAQWTEWGLRELLGWPGVLALVTEHQRKVCGFIIGRQVEGEAEILNLAVIPAKRRQGEGSALLKVAMDEFLAQHVSRVFLEVRESNEGGIAFYERHGFAKTGRRASYYRNPDEAAVTMEKNLSN